MRKQTAGPGWVVLAVSAGAAVSPGCKYPVRGQPLERFAASVGFAPRGSAYDPPQMRMGSMPFDAWYSPYSPLGVDDLGVHMYVPAGSMIVSRNGETSRGILYCAEAGFLDISHVRNAIDLTRYVYEHVLSGFTKGLTELRIVAAEPDVYVIKLNTPREWVLAEGESIPHEDARLAAIAIAGRVAYLMTTWHEVLTWFGYKGMGIITEKPSAFSYDDAASHRVGVEAAQRALRNNADLTMFEARVTAELHDYLIELGVLPVDENVKRMKAVKGKWWADDKPVLRVLDLGMDGEPLEAMIVDERLTPVSWVFRGDESYGNHAVENLFDVWIEMNASEAGRIRELLKIPDARPIHPHLDFGPLREILRKSEAP